MLPSDHFVRMYNEMFKMLEEKGHAELQSYWMEIAKLQDTILGPYITKDGLKGMYDYWARINIEENCGAAMDLTEDYFEFAMTKCPSLSKVLDNDAQPSPLYCDHCAGWVKPVVEKYGYFYASDTVSHTQPVCVMRIYKDKAKADAFLATAKLPAKPY